MTEPDLFRAQISGQLARVVEILLDVDTQVQQYNKTVPNTILTGDRTTLQQARIAVSTVLKGIDQQRKVMR